MGREGIEKRTMKANLLMWVCPQRGFTWFDLNCLNFFFRNLACANTI